jgi:aryl-alcohol dehydrogenase
MAASVCGAAAIIVVDTNQARLALARELGATLTLDGERADLAAAVAATTGGGAQYALDTTGIPSVIETAVNCLRPTGTCGLIGAQQGDLQLGPTALTLGKNLKGILVGDAVPELMIALWRQGRFPFDRLVTPFSLDQINDAERASLRGEAIKPVLVT